MTVTTTDTRDQYNGNGVTFAFTVNFQFLEPDDLLVTILSADGLTETTPVRITDYTVQGGNGATGAVVFNADKVPAAGTVITITRDITLNQQAQLTPNDPLPSSTIEKNFGDRIIMLMQQFTEQLNRSVKLQVSSEDTGPLVIAAAPNATLAFDATGTKIIPGPTTTQIINAEQYALDAAESAAAAAAAVPLLTGTSTSSLTVGLGIQVLTTQVGRQWFVGQRIRVSSDDASQVMEGPLVSYANGILTIDADYILGSGTYADWNIGVAGERGAVGPAGAPGSGTGDMVGPNGGATDGQLMVASGTTGKILKLFAAAGYIKSNALGVVGAVPAIPLVDLASQADNTLVGNFTGAAGAPTAKAFTNNNRLVGRGQSGNLTEIAVTGASFVNDTLVIPNSGLPAAGTAVLSGASSVTINVDFTTYAAYDIYIDGAQSGTGALINIDVSTSGGGGYAGAIRSRGFFTSGGNSSYEASVQGGGNVLCYVGTLRQLSPSDTAMLQDQSGYPAFYTVGLTQYAAAAAINQLKFTCTGNLTANANIRVQPSSLR